MNTFEIKIGKFYINNIELKDVTSWNIKITKILNSNRSDNFVYY